VTGLAKNDSIRCKLVFLKNAQLNFFVSKNGCIIKFCIITLQAALDLYCIITCEGKAVRSFVVNNAQQEASWDLSGIFYRKKSNQPITVEVSFIFNLHFK
jgi:hypothetical protein